jgi:hypothetical protein
VIAGEAVRFPTSIGLRFSALGDNEAVSLAWSTETTP